MIYLRLCKKSLEFLPFGTSALVKIPRHGKNGPAVTVRGKGCKVWDADGDEYNDFRNDLGPVILGYSFEKMNTAFHDQLETGI